MVLLTSDKDKTDVLNDIEDKEIQLPIEHFVVEKNTVEKILLT